MFTRCNPKSRNVLNDLLYHNYNNTIVIIVIKYI